MSLVGGQIDDFVVASFPSPPVTAATAATTASRTTATCVNYTNNAKTDHRVAIASPRVGLAVYDLDDQTPLASISVGPSFAPCTAPASRSTPLTQTASESTRVKSLRKTWIGVRSTQQQAQAADDDATARAGEIWCFHEDENKDGSTGSADAPKAVWPISEPLASIAAPRTLPEHIVFLSETGTLALAPQDDLTKLSSLEAPPLPTGATALASQTLRVVPLTSTTSSDFLPSSLLSALPPSPSQPHLAFIVRTYSSAAAATPAPSTTEASLTGAGKKKHKKQARPSAAAVIDAAESAALSSSASGAATSKICQVELVLLDAAISVPDEFEPRQGMLRLGRVEVPGASEVVISDEGFVTALDASGTLSSYRLGFAESLVFDTYHELFFPTASTDDADNTAAILPLTLNFVKSIPLSTTAVSPARSALLALHSSFVALASPRPRPSTSDSTSQAPSVFVTYWDTRFGSVIASTELAVPSAVAANADEVAVSLSRVGRRRAIVVIEPAAGTMSAADKSIAKRTVLFGLPLNGLPTASVLAAVVGKHTLTAKFVASSSTVATGGSDATASTSTSASISGAAILEQARRAEPMRSELLRSSNEKKAALLEQSRVARDRLLESLAGSLEPLRTAASVKEQDKAVRSAESSWDAYIEAERDRLWEYNKDKVRLAMEKEKERRVAAIAGLGGASEDGGAEPEEGEASRYKVAKRRIERAIAAAGAPVRPGTEASAKGGKSWKDVTAARIKGVNDKYRYRYHSERNKKEAEMGQTVKEFDWEEAVDKVERFEPSLPSSFVTALLRLSFPVPLVDASASLEIAAPTSSTPKAKTPTYRHPTKIVGYLLGRELVGENQVEGGVTRFLARAGDWPNILQALRTVPDIPESTLVSLLVAVVRASSKASDDAEMDVDNAEASLPAPVPRLSTFLAAFLQSPYTGPTLRSALQKQLSPSDAVPVLEQCDVWLKRWLNEAEPVRAKDEDEKRKRKGKGHQTVAVDVFKVSVPDEDVPALDQIVTFVQAVLDAHFVTLLLQRQSHRLLRRLSQHVARHTEMSTDLGSLLGALSIYSSKKEEQRRAAAAASAAAASAAEAKASGTLTAASGVKELGATMEKRIAAQEKHAEVGQYQVEEFYL